MLLSKGLRLTKRCYREINYIWLHKYKIDLNLQSRWSLYEKIKYNRFGFTNEDFFDFQLRKNDYRDYISFRERYRLEDINGRFGDILGEKLMFERLFGNYIGVPHIYCWVRKGKFLDLDAGEETDLLSILKEKETLIAKPTRSCGGGAGVHKISYNKDHCCIDEKELSVHDFLNTVSGWEEYIFVDCIKNADYSNRIYPQTTNTIRVVTARRKDDSISVILAFHRFGTDFSRPVDNMCSGGVFSLIDIVTGTLSVAGRTTEPDKKYSKHPDTGTQIEGVLIPGWDDIKNEVIHVHQCFPFFTFLAWDVVIDEHGKPYILEINKGCDLNVQTIRPLRNDAIGDFMREYGLLDKH